MNSLKHIFQRSALAALFLAFLALIAWVKWSGVNGLTLRFFLPLEHLYPVLACCASVAGTEFILSFTREEKK